MDWKEHLANCVNEGVCFECEAKQLKNCDDCAGLDRVKYCPGYDRKCLCELCRQEYATRLAKSRSW